VACYLVRSPLSLKKLIITFPGIGGVDLVEGTSTTASDTGAEASSSIARIPNGTDTNNAATDWTVTANVTPGGPNVP
jgi:hypothetical protein